MQPRTLIQVTGIIVLTIGSACSVGNPFGQEEAVSPLAEYIGTDEASTQLLDSPPSDPHERQMHREEAIAQCMNEKGFAYTVNTEDLDNEAIPQNPSNLDYAEFTAQYGFGTTTLAFSQDQTGPELKGYPKPLPQQITNPNLAHVEQLSPDSRLAWYEALLGPEEAGVADLQPAEQILDTPSLGSAGCRGETTTSNEQETEFYRQFGDRLAIVDQQVEQDQEWIGYHSELEKCVVNNGLEFVTPETAFNHWAAELQIIEAQAQGPNTQLPEDALQRLEALQTAEIASASALLECQETSAERAELKQKLTHKYQRQFVEQNKASLESFKNSR